MPKSRKSAKKKTPVSAKIKHKSEVYRAGLRGIDVNGILGKKERKRVNFKKSSSNLQKLPADLDEKPFQCGTCRQSFKHLSTLKKHTCTLPHACPYCGKIISTKANLTIHIAYVHGIGDGKYFTCDICGRIYKSKRNIDVHMKVHMVTLPFHCSICDTGFSHRTALKVHMWKHQDPVECEFCGIKLKVIFGLFIVA